MKAITSGVVTVVAAVALTIGIRADSAVSLTVRLYNTSGIPTAALIGARRTAEAILRDADLDMVFRYCGRPASSDDPSTPCEEPLAPSEVVVRVINAPEFSRSLDPDAYGVTYVIKQTNRGWLATVFSDRIEQTAARVGIDSGTLLGRVMAHELGHLLLGGGYHGEAGVMRAEWPDELLGSRHQAWRFSSMEAARMHRVLVSIAHDSMVTPPPL